MAFHVGQKVACISRVTPEVMAAYPGGIWPEKGGIYTIATINCWPRHTLLTLHEIDNSHMCKTLLCKIEPGFNQIHFRPLVERKTDTGFSVLEEIRRRESWPAPTKQPALSSTK